MLYRQAGLDLEADLRSLNRSPRIQADQQAVQYLERYIVFNGQLHGKPVLTLHTTGDGLVQVEHEDAYQDVVSSVRRQDDLLRQVYVHRAGHCTFTPAETITAFQALVQRIDRGDWGSLAPNRLNQQASALGPEYNVLSGQPAGPDYLRYNAPEFLREFDTRREDRDNGEDDG